MIEVFIVASNLPILPDKPAFCRIYVYKHYINQVNYQSDEKLNKYHVLLTMAALATVIDCNLKMRKSSAAASCFGGWCQPARLLCLVSTGQL